MIVQMDNQNWIALGKKGNKTWIKKSDFEFLEKISILHQNGVSLEKQMIFLIPYKVSLKRVLNWS